MKKGFTMIELIFVIVILCILAAVAIPKLAATRNDAKVAKLASNLATFYSDMAGSYTAQGKFGDMNNTSSGALSSSGLKDVTNVGEVVFDTSSAGTAQLWFMTDNNDTKCIDINVTYDGNVTAVQDSHGTSSAVCKQLVGLSSVKALIDVNQTLGGRKVKF